MNRLFSGLMALCTTSASAASLIFFDVNDNAVSQTEFYNGQPQIFASDSWAGSYNGSVTGTTSGSSSLPNPGNEASGSGAFMADHTFGPVSWELSGWAQGSIDAGLGNTGTTFPTMFQTTILSTSLYFFVDTPFTLTLTGMVFESFVGNDPTIIPEFTSQGSISLFAEQLNGQLVNQTLVQWFTTPENNSTGGTYSISLDSGIFRLTTTASALLTSNVQDAFGTQYSSYDAVLSVQPIPEPGTAFLLTAAAFFPLLRRRRPARP
jgi:hypothetical protein